MHDPTNVNIQYQVFEKTGKPFQYKSTISKIELKPGEALVKIILSTICGSDIHTIEGKRKENVPCILGHEAIGEIVALKSRQDFNLGDRVTWTIVDSCGKCPPCTEYGLPEKCDKLFKYGHAPINNGSGLNGCYASHILIRRGTHMVKIPNSVSHAHAAPANCALATMVNAISQLNVKPKKVIIQGGGLLGVYACGLLKEAGVSQIYCLEINEKRFQLIKDFGAIPVDGRDIQKANQFILDRTGDGVDAVFEVAGIKELIPQGLKLLRPGGDYILVGLVHPDSALGITAEQIIRKCIHFKGVHNYAPWHLDESIAFLERNQGRFPYDKLVSPPFDLENIQDAIQEAQKQKWMRVSVKPK